MLPMKTAFALTPKNIGTSAFAAFALTKTHTFEWIVDREATEDETGEKHEECSVCGTKRSEGTEIPKKEKTPSTSDPANLGIWVAVAMLSSLCLAGLIVIRKKKAF